MTEPLSAEEVEQVRSQLGRDSGWRAALNGSAVTLYRGEIRRLLATIDALTARAEADEAELALARAVVEAAKEWLGQRANTRGTFEGHYPIDATIHGNRVDPEVAWGCNAGCGPGWPCLTIRTKAALDAYAAAAPTEGTE